MAVDDMAMTKPMARALFQSRPSSMAAPPTTAAVTPTWAPPRPKMVPRRLHSSVGRTSSPIKNSRITTPNSANFMTSACWPTRLRAKGPITAPATR